MSCSSSASLLSIFKGGKSADDLLKSTEIIKRIFIGFSYIDNKNPNSIARRIFGDEVSHASLLFMMGKKNCETGILVQYGKYEYIKNKKEILNNEAKTIGYPYGEKGGLIFGEINYNLYKKEFCSICCIKPLIDHQQMTLNKFIEEVKKKGPWDYNSYSVLSHNCQHFVAAGISIIKPKYNNNLIEITDNTYFQGKEEEEDGIPKVILNQLKQNQTNNF